jgi:maltose-binding protein MalE
VKRTATAAVLLAALATLTACSSDSSDDQAADKPAAKAAPAYEITKQDTEGTQRLVTVEVKTTDGMEKVFEDVAGKLDQDAGYFVEINCAPSGARLANGKKAVGNIGAASTGLDEGKTEYEALPTAKCPA